MGRSDYAVVTGDFGGVWDDSPREAYWLNWLEEKPFTTLFVDGNHENFDRLGELPVHQWQGGKVHYVRPHVLHLMRGQIFDIGGSTWFAMGGAASHDIQDGILDPALPDFERRYWVLRRMNARFRVLGYSWWPEEMPSGAEYAEAEANLERAGWRVDHILTHCAPSGILPQIDRGYRPDALTDFLETVRQRCRFSAWYLGHYHREMALEQKYFPRRERISEIG